MLPDVAAVDVDPECFAHSEPLHFDAPDSDAIGGDRTRSARQFVRRARSRKNCTSWKRCIRFFSSMMRCVPVQPISQGSSATAHGYEPTREAAMAAFAKSWRRE
jgi:hypothetical protein